MTCQKCGKVKVPHGLLECVECWKATSKAGIMAVDCNRAQMLLVPNGRMSLSIEEVVHRLQERVERLEVELGELKNKMEDGK